MFVPTAALGDAPLEGTKPAQWRLIWTSDPATTATIAWNTAQRGARHELRYRVRGTSQVPHVALATSGVYSVFLETPSLFYHVVRLDRLQPETAYEIEMISDAETSPTFYFVTGPDRDKPLSLLFGGDSRTDRRQRRSMNKLLATLFESSHTSDFEAPVLAFAHGGDYVESGRTLAQWSQWMSDQELTTASDGRLLPIIPTRGNHDVGPYFNDVFAFPAGDTNYYGLNLGSQLRLVTLNTEAAIAGTQSQWLGRELATWRPEVRWLVAQYHRPAYPAVKAPSEALRFWVPLFERYNVDLACEADGHVLKRTVPIRGGEMHEAGVVYVGEGGLGVKQRSPKTTRWFLDAPGMAGSAHHVQILTFTAEHLHYRAVDEEAQAIDELILHPRDERKIAK